MARLIRTTTEKGARRNRAILKGRGKSPEQATAIAKEKKRQERRRRGKPS
jgi:hypothetical protein